MTLSTGSRTVTFIRGLPFRSELLRARPAGAPRLRGYGGFRGRALGGQRCARIHRPLRRGLQESGPRPNRGGPRARSRRRCRGGVFIAEVYVRPKRHTHGAGTRRLIWPRSTSGFAGGWRAAGKGSGVHPAGRRSTGGPASAKSRARPAQRHASPSVVGCGLGGDESYVPAAGVAGVYAARPGAALHTSCTGEWAVPTRFGGAQTPRPLNCSIKGSRPAIDENLLERLADESTAAVGRPPSTARPASSKASRPTRFRDGSTRAIRVAVGEDARSSSDEERERARALSRGVGFARGRCALTKRLMAGRLLQARGGDRAAPGGSGARSKRARPASAESLFVERRPREAIWSVGNSRRPPRASPENRFTFRIAE